MRRVKGNHTFVDSLFADEQAKLQMSKTGLMIAVSFHDDASLAPIGHYTIPKMVSQRGDPTLLAMHDDLAVDVTSYAAVLSGPKTESSPLGALIEATTTTTAV
eukprot:6434078-Amphidinium_carterae.1